LGLRSIDLLKNLEYKSKFNMLGDALRDLLDPKMQGTGVGKG